MQYYKAKQKEDDENRLLRIYETDALKGIVDNTARYAGGCTMTSRWIELLNIEETEVEAETDKRPCAEIAQDIWKRIRGEKN